MESTIITKLQDIKMSFEKEKKRQLDFRYCLIASTRVAFTFSSLGFYNRPVHYLLLYNQKNENIFQVFKKSPSTIVIDENIPLKDLRSERVVSIRRPSSYF